MSTANTVPAASQVQHTTNDSDEASADAMKDWAESITQVESPSSLELHSTRLLLQSLKPGCSAELLRLVLAAALRWRHPDLWKLALRKWSISLGSDTTPFSVQQLADVITQFGLDAIREDVAVVISQEKSVISSLQLLGRLETHLHGKHCKTIGSPDSIPYAAAVGWISEQRKALSSGLTSTAKDEYDRVIYHCLREGGVICMKSHLVALSELISPEKLQTLAKRILSERMLPQTPETRDVVSSLLGAGLSHTRAVPKFTQENQRLAHSIIKLCLNSNFEQTVEQHLVAMRSSLQSPTSADSQLAHVVERVLPLYIFVTGLVRARRDPAYCRLRRELSSLRGSSLGIGLTQFLKSYRGGAEYSQPPGLSNLDHGTYYATVIRPFVNPKGGLVAFFQSLEHSMTKHEHDATVDDTTMRLLLCLSDKVDALVASEDLKGKLGALVTNYARKVDITTCPRTILIAIRRCLQMQVAAGAQIIVERMVQANILKKGCITGADVYSHDRSFSHIGLRPRQQTESDSELRVDTLLKSFREASTFRTARDSEYVDLSKEIALAIEPIFFPWLETFLGPKLPQSESSRQEVEQLSDKWECDRPACTVVKRYLKSEEYPRQRLTLKSLGPRVISHLSKELDENVPARVATYKVDIDIDTIHIDLSDELWEPSRWSHCQEIGIRVLGYLGRTEDDQKRVLGPRYKEAVSWIEGRPKELPKEVQSPGAVPANSGPNPDEGTTSTQVQEATPQDNVTSSNKNDVSPEKAGSADIDSHQPQMATGDSTTPSVLGARNRSPEKPREPMKTGHRPKSGRPRLEPRSEQLLEREDDVEE